MKNLRKIFGAITVLSLTAVTGVNVVGCSCVLWPDSLWVEMSAEILTQLGIYDQEGKPQIKMAVQFDENDEFPDWRPINGPKDVDATMLLDQNNKAVPGAKELLTKYLKLTTDKDGIFDKDEAAKIKLQYRFSYWFFGSSELNLEPTPEKDDLAIVSGKLSFKWVINEGKETKQLAHGTFAILGDPNKGVINDALELEKGSFTLDDFKDNSPLENFKVDEKVSAIEENLDVTDFLALKVSSNSYAKFYFSLTFLGPFLSTNIKFIITEVNAEGETFKEGDTLTLQLSYDGTLLKHEYILELPQA